MKKIALISWACLAAAHVMPQALYKPVDKASTVRFKIKNLGFAVSGSFTGLSGTIQFDPALLSAAAMDVTVDASTVNTDNSLRDEHLRAETYFDALRFPLIRLVSEKITAPRRGTYLFSGRLIIKNHTKDISFPFSVAAIDGGYRFQGSFTLNRRDFEIGGFSTISDQLEVLLNVTAK